MQMQRRGFRGERMDPHGQRSGRVPRPPHRSEGRRRRPNAFGGRHRRRPDYRALGPQSPRVHPTVRQPTNRSQTVKVTFEGDTLRSVLLQMEDMLAVTSLKIIPKPVSENPKKTALPLDELFGPGG